MAQNWGGNIVFSTDRLHRPRTVEELQNLVASRPRLRALGTGHSFNRVADTTGDLVSMADLDGSIVIKAADRTVEVPAGARYGELAVELHKHGWALQNLGSLPHISVAGACATGTHGSGDTNRCLAAAVVGTEFVRGDGELVRLVHTDEDFPGAVISLGALGITTRVTLNIEPAYEAWQRVWVDAPMAAVTDQLDTIMSSGYSVSIFTSWARPDVIDQIWVKGRVGADVPDGRAWGAQPAEVAHHPILGERPDAATQQFGVPGPWHERLPHFRLEFTPSRGHEQQSEYLLPRHFGAAALQAVRSVELQPAIQVFEVRTVAADDMWLSPCHGRDTIAFHFTWTDDDALVQSVLPALEAALAPFDARPHWAKVFGIPAARVRNQYPDLEAFRALAARCDPGRRFGNQFLEDFVYS